MIAAPLAKLAHLWSRADWVLDRLFVSAGCVASRDGNSSALPSSVCFEALSDSRVSKTWLTPKPKLSTLHPSTRLENSRKAMNPTLTVPDLLGVGESLCGQRRERTDGDEYLDVMIASPWLFSTTEPS